MFRYLGDNSLLLAALRKHAPAATLLFALAIFLFNTLRQLQLPGFYYDEGFDITPMLALMRGSHPDLLRGIGLAGWPLMRMDYMGSLNGYLSTPFIALFGYIGARLQPIFYSCVTMVLAFVLARRWFGPTVASITVLLLSVNPSFVWFSRQGITVTSTMTVLSMGSWLLLDLWRTRVQPRASPAGSPKLHHPQMLLLFAGVCLGLGLWDKIIFLWWLILTVIAGAVWLFTTPDLLGTRVPAPPAVPPIGFTTFIPLLVGFIIGALPLIYFNLVGLLGGQGSSIFNLLFKVLFEPTTYGVNNSNFLANLITRWQDFTTFLNGSYFWYQANVPYGNIYSVPAFLIASIVGSLLAFHRVEWRKWLALMLCIAAYLPISSFTVSDLWATHFFVLFPLPQLVVACAAVWFAELIFVTRFATMAAKPQAETAPINLQTRRSVPWSGALVATIALLLLAVPTIRDQWVNESYQAALNQTGGSGRFSDAIYALSSYFDQNAITQPIALDWGIAANVEVVSSGRVRPIEIFGFSQQPDDAFRARAREALANPTNTYVLLWGGDEKWPGFAVFNRRQEFTRLAAEAGNTIHEVFIAHERSGLPVYIVLTAGK